MADRPTRKSASDLLNERRATTTKPVAHGSPAAPALHKPSPDAARVKMTVELASRTHHQLKVRAAQESVPIASIVEALLSAWLDGTITVEPAPDRRRKPV